MERIRFSKEETAEITTALRRYFRDELDHELGQLPAEMLLDFLGEQIGPHFYNRGLYDAHALIAKKIDDLQDEVLSLERRPGG